MSGSLWNARYSALYPVWSDLVCVCATPLVAYATSWLLSSNHGVAVPRGVPPQARA